MSASLAEYHTSNDYENQALCPYQNQVVVCTTQTPCTGSSLEMLIQLVWDKPNLLSILEQLPHDWPALRAARLVLERCRTEEPIVDFAQRVCAAHAYGGTGNAFDERQLCLAYLARLKGAVQTTLEEYQQALGPNPLYTMGQARGLVAITDAAPDQTLPLLEECIRSPENLPTLYHWEEETQSWRSLLIARVYARMFDWHPIRGPEAQELCEQMLTGVRALPDSELRQEYATVYSCFAQWLTYGTGPLPILSSSGSSIQQSHRMALALLHQTTDATFPHHDLTWFKTTLLEQGGLWETDKYKLGDGTFSLGSNLYLSYVFPAIRLATVVLGQRQRILDPAGALMQERTETSKVLREQSWIYNDPEALTDELLENILASLSEQETLTPQDERVLKAKGHTLLLRSRWRNQE